MHKNLLFLHEKRQHTLTLRVSVMLADPAVLLTRQVYEPEWCSDSLWNTKTYAVVRDIMLVIFRDWNILQIKEHIAFHNWEMTSSPINDLIAQY